MTAPAIGTRVTVDRAGQRVSGVVVCVEHRLGPVVVRREDGSEEWVSLLDLVGFDPDGGRE